MTGERATVVFVAWLGNGVLVLESLGELKMLLCAPRCC